MELNVLGKNLKCGRESGREGWDMRGSGALWAVPGVHTWARGGRHMDSHRGTVDHICI